MSAYRAWLCSPAVPAVLLLFGLTYGLAVSHIVGVSWTPNATRIYYLAILLWGGGILARQRKLLRPYGLMDYLFLAFLLMIILSLTLKSGGSPSAAYHAKLLPFLVLLPYGLGRLMEGWDFRFLLMIMPWLGLLVLLLCLLDFWWVPDDIPVLSRYIFFGVNHSPLLIATTVSVAILSLAYKLVDRDAAVVSWKVTMKWGALGAMSAALVLIAARGVLIACAIALVLMMLLVRSYWQRRLLLFFYFISTAAVAFYMLPQPQTQLYSRLIAFDDERLMLSPALPEHAEQIVRTKEVSHCKPLIEGMNSAAIRRLLYAEALDIFRQHPLTGVGASQFGAHSCGGLGAYPHSTILQSLAELGVFGGMILIILYAAGFISLVRIYARSESLANEAVFWFALIAYYGLIDQVYGNYFMSAGSFFLLGVANRFQARSARDLTARSRPIRRGLETPSQSPLGVPASPDDHSARRLSEAASRDGGAPRDQTKDSAGQQKD